MLYRGGLRIGEALALQASDVDPVAGTVRILRGKGAWARTVGPDRTRWPPCNAGPMPAGRGHPRRPALLHPGQTCAQPPVCVRHAQAPGRRTGIDKRVHPHGLRHTHGASSAEGAPIK
jgi:integrase